MGQDEIALSVWWLIVLLFGLLAAMKGTKK